VVKIRENYRRSRRYASCNISHERTISCRRTINSGGLPLFLHSAQPTLSRPRPRRDFRFPSRHNPLAATGRAIINVPGKSNRRGGGLLWDDHNIWTASPMTPRKERGRVHASSQSRAGENIRFGAYRRERKDYLRYVDGAKRKESRRKRHIKGELCGRARECCCSWDFCSSINSVPSSPQNHASIS